MKELYKSQVDLPTRQIYLNQALYIVGIESYRYISFLVATLRCGVYHKSLCTVCPVMKQKYKISIQSKQKSTIHNFFQSNLEAAGHSDFLGNSSVWPLTHGPCPSYITVLLYVNMVTFALS